MVRTEPPGPAVLRAGGGRLLRASVRRTRASMCLLALCTLLRVLATLATPIMLARAVDAVHTGGPLGSALTGLAAVLAVAALADAGEDLAGAYCGSRITAWLRHRLVDRVLELGVPGRRRFPTGDVLARLTESASGPAAFPVQLMAVAATLATTAGAVVALALIDWTLALAFALGVPPAVVVLRVFVARASAPFADYQRHQAAVSTRLLDAHRGIRTIRAGGTAEREAARILAPLPRLREAGHRTWAAQGRASRRMSALAPLLQVLVVTSPGCGSAPAPSPPASSSPPRPTPPWRSAPPRSSTPSSHC
ncbi:ABC transporter transmembrane domain-containing protein [Actinomadura sp. CNU-125]|uniref:ABC transporter transmembrane domain-containing protein n=1 Tax=Actinomadura sp. CNU-125 TaxID=1904961 RepID=UPI0009F97B0A|nr:ABC transporter transmembrane domain-containing protein [Actinomadura sp. CNU-125]